MGAIIGEVVEGLISGIRGAVTRAKVAKTLESIAAKIRRGQLVSDEALSKANATLDKMRASRAKYKNS